MSDESSPPASPLITSDRDAPLEGGGEAPWGSRWQVLTAGMRERGGSLGVVKNVLRKGEVGCPFHWHLREDEVFYVISGRGLFRYGDTLTEVSAGDCLSCPAGTRVAHQIANPHDEPLVYLAMGPRDPHEVCGYPDSGKLFARGAGRIGFLEDAGYMDGEPEEPVIFGLHEESEG